MEIFIKSARVIDPGSPYHNKTISILIRDGIIREMGAVRGPVSKSAQIIDQQGLHVSPGFFDMQVSFRDPGHEYKEDLDSGCKAAAHGGFTGVALQPGTHPPVHTKSEIEYVKKKSAGNLVDVHPYGAITQNLQGKELAEMYDMHTAGAVAFSDDKHPVKDAGLLLRALLYVRNFGGLLIPFCDDATVSLQGMMHEGKVSTTLGLKGIPALAEDIMVARNLFLLEYTGGRMHFPTISTAGSVELIREAKKKKLKVTASVNAHHLALDDSAAQGFDSHVKVNPPLRSKEHIAALKKGLSDGTLDAIISDHAPEDAENKNVEFDYAAFGMTGLETCFGLAVTYSGLPLTGVIKALAVQPRKILGLPVPKVRKNEKANLTFFLPNKEWKLEEKHILSKSKNTPFLGKKLKGKVIGVVNNGQVRLAE